MLAICFIIHTWSELHHDPVLRLRSPCVKVSRPRTPCRHRVKISIITRLSLVPHHGHRSNTRMKIVFSIEEVNFCPSLAAGEMCGGWPRILWLFPGLRGQSPDTGSWGHLLPQHLSTGFYLYKIYDSYSHKSICQYKPHPFLYFSPGSGIKSSWNLRIFS